MSSPARPIPQVRRSIGWIVHNREVHSDDRSQLERERDAILAEARAVAEEWLIEADDEWNAIVDRALAMRDEILAEGRASVERMQQDADARIAAERDVILVAAREQAAGIVADAEREAAHIVNHARVLVPALDRSNEVAPMQSSAPPGTGVTTSTAAIDLDDTAEAELRERPRRRFLARLFNR